MDLRPQNELGAEISAAWSPRHSSFTTWTPLFHGQFFQDYFFQDYFVWTRLLPDGKGVVLRDEPHMVYSKFILSHLLSYLSYHYLLYLSFILFHNTFHLLFSSYSILLVYSSFRQKCLKRNSTVAEISGSQRKCPFIRFLSFYKANKACDSNPECTNKALKFSANY